MWSEGSGGRRREGLVGGRDRVEQAQGIMGRSQHRWAGALRKAEGKAQVETDQRPLWLRDRGSPQPLLKTASVGNI